MELRVDRAHESDWATVRDLRLRALADAPDAFGSTLAEEADQPESFWRARLAAPGGVTLIATVDGAPVGLLRVADTEHAGTGGIYSVWVAPAARGRGVGDALMVAGLAEARARGFARLVLDAGVANPAAQALYRRHGFAATGRRFRMPPPRDHIEEEELARDLSAQP